MLNCSYCHCIYPTRSPSHSRQNMSVVSYNVELPSPPLQLPHSLTLFIQYVSCVIQCWTALTATATTPLSHLIHSICQLCHTVLNSPHPQHALCKMCNYPSLWVMFVTTPLQPFSPTLFFFFPTELTLRRTPRLLTMLPWSENMWIYLKGNDLLRSALLDRFLPCFLACFCVFFSVKHHYLLPSIFELARVSTLIVYTEKLISQF